jgi:hypothetical protein
LAYSFNLIIRAAPEACEASRKKVAPMVGLSHVVLHIGFCAAIARAQANTTIAVSVRLTDRIGRTQFARRYRVPRGDDAEAVVEFDSGFGIYRLDVDAPKYRCSVSDYLYFIPEHDRAIAERLEDRPGPPPRPVLLSGTAPQSFLYVAPTFVLFDKRAVACDKPIVPPLTAHIAVENDQDAYYASFYSDSSTDTGTPQLLALRLRTPTHQYHYVRIPIPFPIPWGGWPNSIQFNVTEEMLDSLAGDPVNTLLCPKLWRTSAG